MKKKKMTVLNLGLPFLIRPAIQRNDPHIRIIDFPIFERARKDYKFNSGAPVSEVRVVDEQGNNPSSGTFGFG